MASVVSSRYARALADVIADSKLDTAHALEQLNAMAAAFEISAELREVWESPAIAVEQKRKVLDALGARVGVTDRPIRNFVAVLIDQDRIGLIAVIARELEEELNRRAGRVEATIVSARELGEEQRVALTAEIARLTGKQVAAGYTTDPGLLGGVVVKVGSTIYDGSVRGQLERIRRQLTED